MKFDLKDFKRRYSRKIYLSICPEWQGNGKLFTCPNPEHEDKNPSCFAEEKDGEVRHHCFGCGIKGDCFTLIGQTEGIKDFTKQYKRAREIIGIDEEKKKREIEKIYDYLDESGKLITQTIRYKPKGFAQRRPDPDNPGKWIWKTDALVIYNLQCVIATETVYIVEGEKDADTLNALRLTATCNPMGAGKWRPEYNKFFQGKNVIIIPDNDKPGRDHALQIAKNLKDIALSSKVLELPGLKAKGDISDWLDSGGTKEHLLALAEQAPEWTETETEAANTAGNEQENSPYTSDETGLYRDRQTREGVIKEKLCNFDAKITREVILDDGHTKEQFFEISGRRGNVPLRPVQIRTKEFQNMNWIIENWGNQAVIEVGQTKKDFIRHYIQTQSGNAQRQTIYCHTGWREINGQWVYLSGNGAIGGGPDICVDFSRKHLAEKYALPLLPENEIDAIKASLNLLDVADRRITIPLYSLVFLSAVTTLLKPMPTFSGGYLYGHTGIRKTALACLFNSHFGDITSERLINFESTVNSIITKMSTLKDCLMILDDYRPTHDRNDALKMESIAQRAIRLSGNRATRERLNPDSTLKRSSEPQGMILITGEELVRLPSTLARTMVIEISREEINLNLLTELQAKAAMLPHAMTSFILWVRENMKDIRDGFYPQFVKLRAKAASNNIHGKLIEQVAYLHYSMALITQWAHEKSIISEQQATELETETWQILNEQVRRQSQIMEHGDPINSFFDMFGTWITQGKIRIDGKELPDKFMGGAMGEFLGYYDDVHFYLLPSALWNYLQRYCIAQGEHFPFSKHTFYKMLKDRRLIETDKDRNTKTERIKGEPKKVLKILRQGVYPEKAVTVVTEGANAYQ